MTPQCQLAIAFVDRWAGNVDETPRNLVNRMLNQFIRWRHNHRLHRIVAKGGHSW